MATVAQLEAQYNALQKVATGEYETLRAFILTTHGAGYYRPITNDLAYVGKQHAPDPYRRLGLPDPGQHLTAAQAGKLNTLLSGFEKTLGQMQTIYGELHPGTGLSDWEVLGIMLLAVAGAAAATAAVSGGAGAAAGTAGGASGGATLSTVGTGAITAAGETAGASAAGELAATSIGSTASAAASAASTVGAASSAIGKAVTALTGSSTAGSLVSDIAGGIGKLLTDVESILSPVTSAASKVLNDVEAFNKSVVQPLSDTVLKDYNITTGLVGEIKSLAHSGIEGILAIPSTLAHAFTSLDASNLRLAKATGQINSAIVTDQLVPGIGEQVGTPIANLGALLGKFVNPASLQVADLTGVNVNEVLFDDRYLKTWTESLSEGFKEHGLFGDLFYLAVGASVGLFKLAGGLETLLSYMHQAGLQLNPIEPLGVAEVIRARWRGQITPEAAGIELARHGLDATRQKLLFDLEQWLPGASEAVVLFWRGLIDDATYRKVQSAHGMTEQDARAVSEAALEPVDPREAIHANGRLAAAQSGFLRDSLNSSVPPEYTQLYAPRLRNPDIGKLDWLEHWKVPDVSWFIVGYFRGLFTLEDVHNAAKAENIPPEIVDKLIPVEQELIQLWMIPDMLSTGILGDQEATAYLEKMGIDPQSAAIILKYGKAKAKAAPSLDPLGLAKISEGNAKAMLQDGIIGKSEFVDILVAQGYNETAAALMADLTQQEIDLTARRNYAVGLIDQALAGLIDPQTLQTSMYNNGYTTNEVKIYLSQYQEKVGQRSKKLSNTEIKDFLGAGLMTDTEAYNALQLNGYSPRQSDLFLSYWSGAVYHNGQPVATSGASQSPGGGAA